MGAIAGVIASGSEDVEALLEDMLRSLVHRGAHAKTTTVETSKRYGFYSAIGCLSHYDLEAQIAESRTTAVAIDGALFETHKRGTARIIHDRLTKSHSIPSIIRTIMKEPGAFAGLFTHQKRLYAFRDLNGLKPLYLARGQNFTAFASERKALWRIGVKDVRQVRPGFLYTITNGKTLETRLQQLPRPVEKKMTMLQASSRLSTLLKKSIERVTNSVDRVAVAFSGGLDSAFTALLAKNARVKVEAVCVGLSGSIELTTAEKFAHELDLPIHLETFNPDSLEDYVRRVLWLIEEPNLMKVSVAVPLHWAASVASRRRNTVMLCGQGSDELYGGYYKYARILSEKGRSTLVDELYRSVVESSQVNYERDDQATSPFGVEFRTPYADFEVITFSLTIPSEFKVKDGDDVTRKWVLRNAAKSAGLPDDIVWRRKKAIQHGTGVENAIRKIAKQQGLTTEAYLSKLHQEVIRYEFMP